MMMKRKRKDESLIRLSFLVPVWLKVTLNEIAGRKNMKKREAAVEALKIGLREMRISP
jgi:hypothetical protein